ncbi:N-6 DNA methylase [Haliea sp. E1-2-M8]|uniref:class I SAM-dependent DNA methyltransferase n=1 Tax=Haliea sp. E1-2-M8 TaxID=3064706 RepID=UPI00271F1EDB|nr:DNA methyltransferase [Haliea sp. E1-2-M8]MDO8861081.1 N-6 DNA methylase [Haliea sp. E1-2-M8]
MTPEAFVTKWSSSTTNERAAAQEHFIDLCRLFEEPTPNEADPTGEWYAFEKGVEKTGAGRGWADVWKRGHFGWEYKSRAGGRTSTMRGALQQLQLYALALESPPLLVVSDIDTIEIHTAFQNAVQEVHIIELEDILQPDKRDILRAIFRDPGRLRPSRTRNQVTSQAAGQFAQLAFALRSDGHDPQRTAHFLNKLLFCMFSEDVGILKTGLFTDIAEKGVTHPQHFNQFIQRLFQAMHKGGPFGTEIIDWFNGGLFDDDDTLPLTLAQIRTVRDLAHMDWSQIEPAIFGTLFERGLDPSKRSQLGAHYTDPQSIMRLVIPTIVEPLLEEWSGIRSAIADYMQRMEKAKSVLATKKNRAAAEGLLQGFLERLRNFRVLDPACGSGNFLYLSLQALKDIEHRANIEAEALGLQRYAPMVGPEVVHGIELNAYAAELARVTVWIGEIQWMLSHGYSINTNPVLKPLDNIERRDAILSEDDIEPDWPTADVIVGNPPFLGSQLMLSELGEDYVEKLRRSYAGRISGGADLVTYWYEKSLCQLKQGRVQRIGLVATNSIRGGRNRDVLNRIVEDGTLYHVWSDESWINEGAAVRVSLICFRSKGHTGQIVLNGAPVDLIQADLSSRGESGELNLSTAKRLSTNRGLTFQGSVKVGKFDVPGDVARNWLIQPNAHGSPNREVLRPLSNAMDIVRRQRDIWIVDFNRMSETEAAQYQAPFEYILNYVKPVRENNRDKSRREKWWLHGRTGDDIRAAVSGMGRVIVTPRVSKYRIFVWRSPVVYCDDATVTVASESDVVFGVLHSRFHEIWALAMGTWLGVGNDPRYTPTSTFETFPFPVGLEPNLDPRDYANDNASDIAQAAEQLDRLRNNWLNPQEWTELYPADAPGYPPRIVPKLGHEADLKKRTLTNLYNARPRWLMNAHRILDEAVASAYGWSIDLKDDEILTRLLELNLDRAP